MATAMAWVSGSKMLHTSWQFSQERPPRMYSKVREARLRVLLVCTARRRSGESVSRMVANATVTRPAKAMEVTKMLPSSLNSE